MMNFAKTCVFTIKCVFIAKITSIFQRKKKTQNIELVGRGRGVVFNRRILFKTLLIPHVDYKF
jgi:hypothetical protein